MKLKPPIILLNYKTYYQTTGWRAINLSESADRLAKEYGVTIVVAPQFVDISPIADQFDVPVFTQHIDPISPGSHTGQILPDSIKEAGAIGTLLNHAERKLPFENLEESVSLAKKLDLQICICAENLEVAGKTADLNPEYVAFELPELIGTGQSISKTEPDLVKSSVKQIRDTNSDVLPLCGAGISDGKDVYAALKLETQGVLVASAVAKATDPEFVLIDMINGINKYLDEE